METRKEDLAFISSKNNPAILGTLTGPCADIIHPTRNERLYSDKLWENVFNNEIVKEYFEAGGVFGELGHPADRSETDMEKIAICMPEPPTKGKNGLLMGRWDILNTPNGRILKTLVDYGYKIGISSRGTGDVYTDENGQERVDEDTYDFQGFDAVLLPAVKAARLEALKESYNSKTLKQALTESLNKASEDEKKVMKETLKDLNINLDETNECNSENCSDIKSEDESIQEQSKIQEEAINNGSDEIIKDLQEAVKNRAIAEARILELQNKLAVSDTEVKKVNEELARYKSLAANLSISAKNAKRLSEEVSNLKEQITKKDLLITKLNESKKSEMSDSKRLTESLDKKDKEIKVLKENFKSYKTQSEAQVKELTENIEILRKESEEQHSDFSRKIAKTSKLAESYKKLANDTIRRYIESKADMIGVTANEIRSKLNEKFTVEDIDKICEDLQSYKVNISKLPFKIDRNTRVKVVESKNDNLRIDTGIDDDVDESLMRMAKNY